MKVLGIGNALVDILVEMEDDALLLEFGLPKGSMTLVDKESMNTILKKVESLNLKITRSSGGSVANAIYGMAKLGTSTRYIGKIGNDRFGDFFKSYMIQSNINANLFIGKNETGKCITLVSKDSERTFATYLGAAIELESSDLNKDLFETCNYLLLEGYLVQNYQLVEKAINLVKEAGSKIAIDLASYNVVQDNLNFLKDILANNADIIFANEDEAKAFTGIENPEDALMEISKNCNIAIVKVGPKGSFIRSGDQQYKIPAIDANNIDTTGAGDLYAAGFFYGLTNGQKLDICGKIGSIVAGKIIEVIGAKMNEDNWNQAIKMINDVVK